MSITTTAAQVAAAVNAAAPHLVLVSNFTGNDGSGAVTAMPVASLAGGDANTKASVSIDPTGSNNKLTFTAADKGADGNLIRVVYVAPADDDEVLTVLIVDGHIIIVQLGSAADAAVGGLEGNVLTLVSAKPTWRTPLEAVGVSKAVFTYAYADLTMEDYGGLLTDQEGDYASFGRKNFANPIPKLSEILAVIFEFPSSWTRTAPAGDPGASAVSFGFGLKSQVDNSLPTGLGNVLVSLPWTTGAATPVGVDADVLVAVVNSLNATTDLALAVSPRTNITPTNADTTIPHGSLDSDDFAIVAPLPQQFITVTPSAALVIANGQILRVYMHDDGGGIAIVGDFVDGATAPITVQIDHPTLNGPQRVSVQHFGPNDPANWSGGNLVCHVTSGPNQRALFADLVAQGQVKVSVFFIGAA